MEGHLFVWGGGVAPPIFIHFDSTITECSASRHGHFIPCELAPPQYPLKCGVCELHARSDAFCPLPRTKPRFLKCPGPSLFAIRTEPAWLPNCSISRCKICSLNINGFYLSRFVELKDCCLFNTSQAVTNTVGRTSLYE